MQTKYDKIVERCCRVALNYARNQPAFIATIIDDIIHELPELKLTRNQISFHVNVALGCVYAGNSFTAKKWIVADKEESDISELLRMLRNEY